MNVTFHIVSAIGATAVLSSSRKHKTSDQPATPGVLAAGLTAGVLLHGLLDYAPHSYPINSMVDVAISLALLALAMFFVKPVHRMLLGVCALGSVFSDLVDLAPAIINKRLGWSLPVFKIFPWHWRQYSGSIYDGSRKLESLLCHLLVLTTSLILVYIYRRSFFTRSARSMPGPPSRGGAGL